jgi:formylglycine-generating enzyme required for sulfatase activity
MLETEVTQALYQEIMGTNPSLRKGKFLPVEQVSWYDATKFCAELTKRLPEGLAASLPTEAQWEYACRAGTKTAYSYGKNADPSKMNCIESRKKGTTPVKSYPANAWGLYDMHGNVREWTSTADGGYRVGCGGSWYGDADDCEAGNRGGDNPDDRFSNLGFRLAH